MPDAGHGALEQVARALGGRLAEPQRVQHRDRPGADREDVAQDAADAGARKTLLSPRVIGASSKKWNSISPIWRGVERWLAGDALRRFSSRAPATALLVNNAGMLQPVGAIEGQDAGAIARAVSLNVATPLMSAAALAARARGAGAPHRACVERRGTQCVSRLEHLLRDKGRARSSRARRRARRQPRAADCSVAPGVVDTDMQGEIRATGLERFPLRERFEALKRERPARDARAVRRRKLVDYALSDTFGARPSGRRDLP